MASAPLVNPSQKPSLSQGTTYRLALFTTEPSISQLDIVLTGAGGEHSLSLVDGSNCKWVWSSSAGPARQKKDQIDVYDLNVPDVGDISSVKLQFDTASATQKGTFGFGKKVDDYNFKHIEILRVSNSRDAVFTNPNPKKVMDDKNTSVTIPSPGTLPAGESHVKLPASSSGPQSPSAAGGGAAMLPSSSSVLQSPSAAGGAAASAVSGSDTVFTVSVLTGSSAGAGSDGKVAVKFHGVQGETAKFDLDQLKLCSDDIQDGNLVDEKQKIEGAKNRKLQKFFNDSQETYFRIVTQLPDNFGDVTAVTLFHECKVTAMIGDDWEPKEISVKMGEGEVETKFFAVPPKTKMTKTVTSVKLTSFEGTSSVPDRRKKNYAEKCWIPAKSWDQQW
jgi:hypothetical protein